MNRSPFAFNTGVSGSFFVAVTLSFTSLACIARWPALLRSASAVAPFVPWTWSLLTQSVVRHTVIGQTPSAAGFLRLTRLMNVAVFAAAFIVPFVFAHGPRVFGFSIHSGNYLLPLINGMEALRIELPSGAVTAMRQ